MPIWIQMSRLSLNGVTQLPSSILDWHFFYKMGPPKKMVKLVEINHDWYLPVTIVREISTINLATYKCSVQRCSPVFSTGGPVSCTINKSILGAHPHDYGNLQKYHTTTVSGTKWCPSRVRKTRSADSADSALTGASLVMLGETPWILSIYHGISNGIFTIY